MKTRSLVLLLCAALALVLGAWLWWSARAAPADALARAPRGPEAPAASRAELSPSSAIAAAETPAARDALGPASPAAEAARAALSAAAAPSSTLLLRGRVIVLDADGRALAPADGELLLNAPDPDRSPGSLDHPPIQVHAGEWSLELDARVRRVSPYGFRLGARFVPLEREWEDWPIPPERFLEFIARLPAPAQLVVRDAASGSELTQIELVRAAAFPNDDAQHPGLDYAARVFGSGLASPIDLDALERAQRADLETPAEARLAWVLPESLLVGAPGFAWKRVELDPRRGGQRTVLLQASCGLDAFVSGLAAGTPAVLRLRAPEGGPPIASSELRGSGTLALRGLAPGSLRVAVEVGKHWWGDAKVLASAELDLRAGAIARVELLCATPPQVLHAPAAGELFVPNEWGRELLADARLNAQLLGSPLDGGDGFASAEIAEVASTRDGFMQLHWSFAALELGRYSIQLAHPCWIGTFELPAGGRQDFAFELGPPAVLELRVLDARSGAEVDTLALDWNPRRPEGARGGTVESVERDSASGLYVIRAPVGPIELQCWDDDYLPFNEAYELLPGRAQHTIRLERACGVRVRLVDGNVPIPFPQGWANEPVAEPGTDGSVRLSSYGAERRFLFSAPGRYGILAPKLDGYRQPPKQVVDVPAGVVVELDIALEREQP